tara:strand:- start:19299 stop:20528 length:1230 start_codon:yes stop_codon:yes gene_type:complete
MSNGTELIMPKLGLTMTEGTISEWVVAPGDSFSKGDVILVVETEKIANEIEAPADGVFKDILVPAGETVPVGAAIARWNIGAAIAMDKMPKDGSPVTSETPEKQQASAPAASASAPIARAARDAGTRIVATPLARRIARQNNIDLGQVSGSGPRGRIKADDVRAAIPALAAKPREGARQVAAPSRRAPTSYEATVARRLSEAKRETPHFYLATEVDAGRLLDLKDQLNDEISGVKISVNHLIIAAVAKALAEDEKANSVWQEGEIVTYDSVDIGVAVNTDNGLFAPVLKNLGDQDIVSIAAAAKAMVEKARSGKLAGDDLAGGATTISNAGMFDVTYMSSIINPGQSSILGVGSIRETFRPSKKGKPVLKQEMGLVLSCDHRIFDGVSGLTFLNAIKSYLEKPLKLLVK